MNVLNYCSLEDTVLCIDAVRRLDYPNLTALVMDNGSPDGSGSELARVLPPSGFIQLPKNIGFAGGHNHGIKVALGRAADFVLILNPDVRVPADSIRRYVTLMAADDTIGALNSIQVGSDGVTVDASFLAGVLEPAGYRYPTVSAGGFPSTVETEILFGAALMLRASAIERVGGFDPLYFAYGEEVDLCRRLRYHGYRLVVTSQSPVIHLRTNYGRPLSDFILFLKLRGYYLSEIKNPRSSFRLALGATLRDLGAALVGSPPARYPFTAHPLKRSHISRALLWFLLNAPRAWLHREVERRGRAHI